MRSDRQNDQDGAPAAVLAQTPPSAEDAFAVLPQNLTAATLIAFASKRGQRNVADGERTAIAHSRGRADYLWRNRHFADARGYSEIGSFGVQRFCTRVHRRSSGAAQRPDAPLDVRRLARSHSELVRC